MDNTKMMSPVRIAMTLKHIRNLCGTLFNVNRLLVFLGAAYSDAFLRSVVCWLASSVCGCLRLFVVCSSQPIVRASGKIDRAVRSTPYRCRFALQVASTSPVCLSVVCLSHPCSLLKPFLEFRCHIAGTLVGVQRHIVLDGGP